LFGGAPLRMSYIEDPDQGDHVQLVKAATRTTCPETLPPPPSIRPHGTVWYNRSPPN
jgi:hypothetical protein